MGWKVNLEISMLFKEKGLESGQGRQKRWDDWP